MADLAYLFECHFTDGTVLSQNPQDVSLIDPSKSSFYDVMQRIDAVEKFGIYNENHTYAVDLVDGHFEIDGLPFDVHTGDELPCDNFKFRLIYFRRHKHMVTMGSDVEEHTVQYHIGWQTTIDGKNYQQTIAVG